ncbi:MAG: glycosyltransferase [Candidatus Binataceae bacterium]
MNSQSSDPAVSVIIVVYNGASTIATAINSALAQTFDSFEVIVVNDGSADSTGAVLGARNASLAIARGRYLAFLDADDTWSPNKLAMTIAPMDRDPSIVLAYSNLTPVDSSGTPSNEILIPAASAHAPSMDDLLRQWWPIIPSTVAVRRDTFIASGGFDEEFRGASGYEDAFLWLLMRERGPFAYIAEPLVRYHTGGASERMAKYLPQQDLFLLKVGKRYGYAAKALARSTRNAYSSALGHEGLQALRNGDRATARHFFKLALRDRPADLKTALRLLRTWLPPSLARALTGRTGTLHS